ncbi:hypothetical protein QOZ95_005097 [Paenibacillus brasilensis]|uniref:Uncharacterized protein n=1 Tax=Paenibacillus brasilensis TaxID=128574 RepID=A0ABU0L6J8_9BACL|nr:hypothetical protein [Paenibacillus brasilensis]
MEIALEILYEKDNYNLYTVSILTSYCVVSSIPKGMIFNFSPSNFC